MEVTLSVPALLPAKNTFPKLFSALHSAPLQGSSCPTAAVHIYLELCDDCRKREVPFPSYLSKFQSPMAAIPVSHGCFSFSLIIWMEHILVQFFYLPYTLRGPPKATHSIIKAL